MTADLEEKPIIAVLNQRQVTPHRSPYCRKCGNQNINRIPRGRFVKMFLFWLPLKKYICYRCHHKTYRWGSRH